MRWKKCFTVVGCHAAGEVGNVITGGVLDVPGETMFEKMEYFEQQSDQIRKLSLFEPRGAPYVNCNLILPAVDRSADFGFIVMESTEYAPMSGANAICVATVALETGMVEMQEPTTILRMEAPAGMIECRCSCADGKVTEVEFTNVPCFVYELQRQVEVEGIGTITVDTAYGGMNYAYVDAAALGFSLTPDEARELCRVGLLIKEAVNKQLKTVHPENEKITGVSNVVFQGPVSHAGNRLESQSATVVLHGRIDRSPCGTGTAGRVAVLHAKGILKEGDVLKHISLAGTSFNATVKATTTVAGLAAVIPTVAGQAWITSMGQYGLDPTDPYPEGHILSDVWF